MLTRGIMALLLTTAAQNIHRQACCQRTFRYKVEVSLGKQKCVAVTTLRSDRCS